MDLCAWRLARIIGASRQWEEISLSANEAAPIVGPIIYGCDDVSVTFVDDLVRVLAIFARNEAESSMNGNVAFNARTFWLTDQFVASIVGHDAGESEGSRSIGCDTRIGNGLGVAVAFEATSDEMGV
jgi:hypothetical protein